MTTTTSSSPSSSSPFITIHDTPIFFQEDWKVGIVGGLWSSGLAMAKYLEKHSDHARMCLDRLLVGNSNNNKKLSLLELGSGNGFLALCWLALCQDCLSELVITDTDEHLAMIHRTLQANKHFTTQQSIRITVMEHKWGEFVSHEDDFEAGNDIHAQIQQGIKKFDLIVGSEVAYHDSLYDPLIASLQRFSHDRTVILLGITMEDTKPLFFTKLKQAGFRYNRLADYLMEPEFRGITFGIFVVQRDNR